MGSNPHGLLIGRCLTFFNISKVFLIQADAEVGETRPVAGRGGFRNGTKYNDSYYGRETKFGGYSSQVKPYSAFVSWHWLGAGVTEMRYTLQSGIANAAAGLTNYSNSE